jgi:hypothetical protein
MYQTIPVVTIPIVTNVTVPPRPLAHFIDENLKRFWRRTDAVNRLAGDAGHGKRDLE